MSKESTSILMSGRQRGSEAALPAVEELFRAVGSRIRSRMVNRTSANFEVRLAGVEVKKADAIAQDSSYKGSGVFGVIRFDAAQSPALTTMQRELLTRIIGSMLGDDDGSREAAGKPRPLSPVEKRIAHRFYGDLVSDLGACWPIEPTPEIFLDGVPGGPRAAEAVGSDDTVFVGTFDFGPTDDPFGLMAISIPTQALWALQPTPAGSGDIPRADRSWKIERVGGVDLDVVAEMARLPMRVRDLRQLKVGDLVPLGALDGAVIRVNDRPMLVAEPGYANGQRSVRVLRKLQ